MRKDEVRADEKEHQTHPERAALRRRSGARHSCALACADADGGQRQHPAAFGQHHAGAPRRRDLCSVQRIFAARVSASSSDGVLDLVRKRQRRSAFPAEGYVYDQNLNSYSTPAYSMNGTTYVPVKLCCGKFGLSYSTLAVAGETVLRVTDGSASSDSAFGRRKIRYDRKHDQQLQGHSVLERAPRQMAPRQMAARQRSRTRLPFRRLRKSRRASRHGCT